MQLWEDEEQNLKWKKKYDCNDVEHWLWYKKKMMFCTQIGFDSLHSNESAAYSVWTSCCGNRGRQVNAKTRCDQTLRT